MDVGVLRLEGSGERIAGLRLLEREESELGALRERLMAGLRQAQTGELAEGSGEDAIGRAFATARSGR